MTLHKFTEKMLRNHGRIKHTKKKNKCQSKSKGESFLLVLLLLVIPPVLTSDSYIMTCNDCERFISN